MASGSRFENLELNESSHHDKRMASFVKMLPIACANGALSLDANKNIGRQLPFS